MIIHRFGIKRRIYSLVLLALLMIGLEGEMGQYSLNLVQERLDIFSTFDLPLVHSLSGMESLLVQMSNQFDKAPSSDADRARIVINNSIIHDQLYRIQMELDRVRELSERALTVAQDEGHREKMRRMIEELARISRAKEEMVTLLDRSIVDAEGGGGKATLPQDVNRTLVDGTERLEVHAGALLDRAEGEMTTDIFESIRQSDTSRHWLREMWLICTVLGLILAVGSARWVLLPLETARLAARRIATGDLDVSLEHHRFDELGEMLTAMREMVIALGERHRVETLVWQSEKMSSLGRLAIGLAHEIVNPLASATLHLELLREKLSGQSAAILDNLDVIDRCMTRVSGIARDLLTFSRPKGSDALPVHVHDLIEVVLVLVGNQLKGVEVVRQFAPDLPDILGVAGKLDQLFMNLIRNALESMPQGGMLVLTTAVEEDAVEVVVRDSGAGIAPHLREKVLEPFFTTRQDRGGVGLGLSVCQEVVNQHGATMTLGDAPEGGLMVVLRFPLKKDTGGSLSSDQSVVPA
ncbi:MAG: HAMP domain-containing protein [Magnetococcales bacterium]|nr:HAMP domain-containing protein [Magnetococcales bacterium]